MEIQSQKRKFLGKTENFKDKAERAFNQRMLKAYLAGHAFFAFGKSRKVNPQGFVDGKAYYPVLQQKPEFKTLIK